MRTLIFMSNLYRKLPNGAIFDFTGKKLSTREQIKLPQRLGHIIPIDILLYFRKSEKSHHSSEEKNGYLSS